MAKDRDRLLEIILGWAVFTAVFPTIVLYRAAVQPHYHWGFFGVQGTGPSSGYLVVIVAAALAWYTIFLGSRGTRPPFGMLLVLWNSSLLASILYAVARFGSSVDFRGDAMGIRIPVSVIGPVIFGAFLMLSALWWWRNRGQERWLVPAGWPKSARIMLGLSLLLAPCIVLLFAQGDGAPHTNMDRIAIVLVVTQCLLVSFAFGAESRMKKPAEIGADFEKTANPGPQPDGTADAAPRG
jgi:hypothetical protein